MMSTSFQRCGLICIANVVSRRTPILFAIGIRVEDVCSGIQSTPANVHFDSTKYEQYFAVEMAYISQSVANLFFTLQK